MVEQTTPYGISTTVNLAYPRAVERTREALAAEGFGILTEIEIKATLKKKLDVDFRPYTILGACNPPLAHRAIQAEPEIGLLLPCNVTVRELEGGRVSVGFLDPQMMVGATGNPALHPVADEAAARLDRARAALAAQEGKGG